MQGFGKFGFYEMFKDVYRLALGEKAAQYQTVGFLVSSACAEVIADTLLCPMEAVSPALQRQGDNPDRNFRNLLIMMFLIAAAQS